MNQDIHSVMNEKILAFLEKKIMKVMENGFEELSREETIEIAHAWEAAGNMRMLALLMWLRRISQYVESSDEDEINHYLKNSIDFCFKFFGKRFIGLFFDGIGLVFSYNSTKMISIARMANESPYATKGRIEAAIFGISGSHYYHPDQVKNFELMDIEK